MWCDNCLLIFPLRAGAIGLATIMMLYQFSGGILLFTIGDFLFFRFPEAIIYGIYAIAQGVLAGIAVMGFTKESYPLSRSLPFAYLVFIVLGVVRGGIMIWELQHSKDHIQWECDNPGMKWNNGTNISIPNVKKLPNAFCNVNNTITSFAVSLVFDIIFMFYLSFLIWRFAARIRHTRDRASKAMDKGFFG